MSSLPESYRSTLQTITASQLVGKLSGAQSKALKADDIMSFIIEEAQHRVINNNHTKYAESALAAHMKKSGKGKGKEKNQSKEPCGNCKRTNHTTPDCYSKGGAKKGQGPRQKNVKKMETVVITADDNEGDLFTFTCMSDHAAIAQNLNIPKSKLSTCIDSRASKDYCPDKLKFSNYKSIQCKITTANGHSLSTIGMGDLHIELPNGSDKTKVIFKNAIHAPKMAFTLISIS